MYIVLFALVGCLAAFVISSLAASAPPDLSKEQKPFRSMALPLYSVNGPDCGTGGGPMTIWVIDEKFRRYTFTLEEVPLDRATWDRWDFRPNVPLDLVVPSSPVVLKDSRRSRALLAYLVEKYGERGGLDEVFWSHLIDENSYRWKKIRWKIQRFFR